MAKATNTPAIPDKGRTALVEVQRKLMAARAQLEAALSGRIKPEHMIRVAITAISQSPQLMECTHLSLCSGVMRAAELGLELSGPLGHAYLVPRRNNKANCVEATFQVGYRGLIELVDRTGNMRSSPHVRAVREGDRFSYQMGTDPRIDHVPGNRNGPWSHVYAIAFFKGGSFDFEVMTKEEIWAHRNRYAKGADRADSPWKTSEEAMAKKTVLARLLRHCPVSIEVREALSADAEPLTLDSTPVEANGSRSDQLMDLLDPQDQVTGAPSDEDHTRQVPAEPETPADPNSYKGDPED